MDSPPGNPEFSSRKTEFILANARDGNEAAWRELYERYRRMLVVMIECRMRGALQRRFDADDVLQEAFSKAWSKIDSFEYRGEGTFRTWLCTIVYREFYNLVKAGESGSANAPQEANTAALDGVVGRVRPASQILSEIESKRNVLEKMADLPDDERDLITMRIFEKKHWQEIGDVLGCSRTLARERFDRTIANLARAVS